MAGSCTLSEQTDAPCILRSPPSLPACYCLAYQRCCWCCWMLYGAAARIQLISGWKREDGNAIGTPYSRSIAQKNIIVLLWCLFDPFSLLHRETLPPVEDAPGRILLIRISPDQVRRRLLNLPGMMMISAHFWLWAGAHRGFQFQSLGLLWLWVSERGGHGWCWLEMHAPCLTDLILDGCCRCDRGSSGRWVCIWILTVGTCRVHSSLCCVFRRDCGPVSRKVCDWDAAEHEGSAPWISVSSVNFLPHVVST